MVAAVLAAVTGGVDASARGLPDLILRVAVDDHAGIPASILTAAKREASRIYAGIDVNIVWLHGAPAEGYAAPQVRLLFLSRQMVERKMKAEQTSELILGQANRPAARAYVYWHRVAERAARYGRATAECLAMVIAHEVGHLLLPENSHSAAGIMQGGFDFREAVGLSFTKSQGDVIRQALSGVGMLAAR